MSRTVTLGQLKQDISDLCDLGGAVGANQRWTPTFLNRRINQAIQRFRERLSIEGSSHYLTYTNGTLNVGATSPHSFTLLDLSAVTALVRVYSIEITVSNRQLTLDPEPFTRRNEYGGASQTGQPRAFALYQTDQVAILPATDKAYAYVCWYLPVLTDLADDDNDTFEGVAGWEEYVVWDVVTKLGIKDQYPDFWQQAMTERNQVWADVLKTARTVSKAQVVTTRDTFGAKLSYTGRKPPLPPPG